MVRAVVPFTPSSSKTRQRAKGTAITEAAIEQPAPAWRMLPERTPRPVEDLRDALVIRHGGIFLLTERDGEIPRDNRKGLGLYRNDTRYLSIWELVLPDVQPLVLTSTAELGYAMEQVMISPELVSDRGDVLPGGSLQIRRQRVIDQSMLESVQISNFGRHPVTVRLVFRFAADFADIFEVRGVKRESSSDVRGVQLSPDGATLRYLGLDGIARFTRVLFQPCPDELEPGQAVFLLSVPPGQTQKVTATVSPDSIGGTATVRQSTAAVADAHTTWRQSCTRIATSNDQLNTALERSIADLRMLWTEDGALGYVSAGIPWFDTLFGRDSLLTAIMQLAFRPQIARDALRALASYQGRCEDAEREEQPGKIVHEVRRSETANTNEVILGRYYGSIDATPLFILLAAEYYRWTADIALMRELEPAIAAALSWMDRFGDIDGDGYLEYIKRTPRGLDNQGWKDSHDAIIDEEGDLLEPPIALVEVQGYAYAARRGIAAVYDALGDPGRATQLRQQADRLRRRINSDFWLSDGYYALALDAAKRPSRVRASNAGQLLWTGVPTRQRAHLQSERLLRRDMFSGWGIRTLSNGAPRHNPLGYHLGTVWPHDNALIIAGLKRYGAEAQLNEVASAICQAAFAFPYLRLPELFSGAPRQAHHGPIPYPVACRPQAFAAAALPFILACMLGLVPDAAARRLYIVRPKLPRWLDFVRVSGLRVGEAQVDLVYARRGSRTSVHVARNPGLVHVVQTRRWPAV